QDAENRHLQDDRIDGPSAVRCSVVLLEPVSRSANGHDDDGAEANEAIAEGDDDSSWKRQLRAETCEQVCERRNDLPENDTDDQGRNHDDRDRIDHGGFDLPLQLDGLFDVGREALENRVENTVKLKGQVKSA